MVRPDGKIFCEICTIRPATGIKGGVIEIEGKETRAIFVCCDICKEKINNTRTTVRKEN